MLGHALQATIIVPELLVHHWWNDSYRLDQLIDIPHWTRAAAGVGVHVVTPSDIKRNLSFVVSQWFEECGRKGALPDSGKLTHACRAFHVGLPKGGTVDDARKAIAPVLAKHGPSQPAPPMRRALEHSRTPDASILWLSARTITRSLAHRSFCCFPSLHRLRVCDDTQTNPRARK